MRGRHKWVWKSGALAIFMFAICLATKVLAYLSDSSVGYQTPDLQQTEYAAVILAGFSEDVLDARCRYLGALGNQNGTCRKGINNSGMFGFRGADAVWGNAFWTCRLSSNRTPNDDAIEIRLPRGQSLWVHEFRAGVNSADTPITEVRSNKGKSVANLMQQLPEYSTTVLFGEDRLRGVVLPE